MYHAIRKTKDLPEILTVLSSTRGTGLEVTSMPGKCVIIGARTGLAVLNFGFAATFPLQAAKEVLPTKPLLRQASYVLVDGANCQPEGTD